MFDSLKGMGQLAGLMKDLPRLKEKMEQVRERLGEMTVEAETGGGAVRAVADGKLRIVKIETDQSLLRGLIDSTDPDDVAMAQDLITGAVNAALVKSQELAQQEMANAAQEMGLPIPPGGLGGMLP